MDGVFCNDFLTCAMAKIRESRPFQKVEQAAHFRGYSTELQSGVFEHGRQTDLFVAYEVKDRNGEIVDTFDDGFLTAYEPLAKKNKHGSWKIVQGGYEDFLSDLEGIGTLLKRSSFVALALSNARKTQAQVDGGVTIKKWPSGGTNVAIIEINPNMQDRPFSIGDYIVVEGQTYLLIKLA